MSAPAAVVSVSSVFHVFAAVVGDLQVLLDLDELNDPDAYDPAMWYSYSKILAEHLFDRYIRHEKLPATIFRYARVFGSDEILNFPQFPAKYF